MSLGYAEKLSYIEDVGSVGMTEYYDTPHVLEEKAERLALMIKKSKHLVVFTGAGISTSCGIPDFRGPKGIWTLQKEGKTMPEASLPFHRAMPSMTHMALVELEQAGILKFIISQNIDGLHLRSGIPREKLSELHGNSFMEMCPSCGVEYIRDFEVETIGLKETTRSCTKAGCGARLRDTVLDWEDALPPKEINPAEKHCKMADLVLCLGTSLQITPACNLPLKCLRNGGEIVIVNLQKTPKDKDASLVIHGFVDKVIAGVMNFLRLQIPPFIRIDLFQTIFTQALSLDKKYVNWTLKLASIHGKKAPLPFIKSVEVSFSESPNMKAAILDKEPFCLKRRTVKTADPFDITFRLNLSEGCKCICAETKIPVHFMDSVKDSVYNFKDDDGLVFDKLRREAMADPNCGQTALFERETILVPKTDIFVHAIVTNIVKYEATQSSTNGLKRKHEGFNGTIPSRKRSKRHWKPKHPLIN